MMEIGMVIGIIMCFILGLVNLVIFVNENKKGNLYTSIFDFAVATFMLIVLIFF